MLPFDPTGVQERLIANSHAEGECHVWDLSRYSAGYGRIHVKDWRGAWPSMGTHRVAMMLARDASLGYLWVLHHCDNPPCFNLDHLFLGTVRDNARDMANKARGANQNTNKTVCLRGHVLDAPGVLSWDRRGNRRCIVCAREAARTGAVRRRTHCHEGHSLAGVPTNARGTRICPECQPARAALAAARNVMRGDG